MKNHSRRHRAIPTLVLFLCSFLLLVPVCPGAAARQGTPSAPSAGEDVYTLDESQLQDEVTECLGIPYRRGGSTLSGMDCSGFSKRIYSRLFGVELPHKASEQYRLGIFRAVPEESLQMGDLIFFKKKSRIDHVGIYLSDGKFAHSVGGKGVVISSLDNPYWKSLLAGSRRLAGLAREELGYRVPVHTLADVQFDEWSTLRLRFSVLLREEGGASGFQAPWSWATSGWNPWEGRQDPPFLIEVGFERRLAMDFMAVRLSAFCERSLLEDSVPVFPSAVPWGSARFPEPDSQAMLRRGLSVGSEINLFEGFGIRPFLVLVEEGATGDLKTDASRSAVGLEAFMTPPQGPYSLSLGVDYAGFANQPRGSQEVWEAARDLTMSLRFQYRLNDLMRISFAGQHGFGDPAEPPVGASIQGKKTPGDLFLLFDLSY